jgi:hypothetical protein
MHPPELKALQSMLSDMETSKPVVTSTNQCNDLVLTMREAGSEVELKLNTCQMTHSTDMEARTHSMTITWGFDTTGSLKLTGEKREEQDQ